MDKIIKEKCETCTQLANFYFGDSPICWDCYYLRKKISPEWDLKLDMKL